MRGSDRDTARFVDWRASGRRGAGAARAASLGPQLCQPCHRGPRQAVPVRRRRRRPRPRRRGPALGTGAVVANGDGVRMQMQQRTGTSRVLLCIFCQILAIVECTSDFGLICEVYSYIDGLGSLEFNVSALQYTVCCPGKDDSHDTYPVSSNIMLNANH